MKKTIFFWTCIINFLLLQVSSFAAFTVTPSVSLRGEYDDNIFLEQEDQNSDFITTIIPAIALAYSPGKMLSVNIDYSLNFMYYSRYNEYSDKNLKDIQALISEVRVNPYNNVFIDIADIYKKVPIDVRRRVTDENPLINKTISNVFGISPHITLPLTPTLSTTVGYKYENTWYDAAEALDYESHSAYVTLDKKISSLMRGMLKYNYYAYRVDFVQVIVPVDDYDRHDGSVGLFYQMTPKIGLNGEVGESKFNFKAAQDSRDTFFNVAAEYTSGPSDNIVTRLYYVGTFHDATTSGTYKHRDMGLVYKVEIPFMLLIKPYYVVDKYIDRDREDRLTGVAAETLFPLSQRLDMALYGKWEKEKFLPETKKVTNYSLRSDLIYELSKKMTTTIGYRYAVNNSNIDTEDFTNNIAWATFKVTF
ncbi:MAG: TIGR03016 family PEP-CTERM system-associated outer membrane protein [Nitrospirae bacterium]|nr:TIGR03016 family PEP-CTERM system-associated outer membrane protein [Nitrospirota bacterium]